MEIPRALAGPWRRAYNLWLETKSPNTRRAYQRAWADLLGFTGKGPQEILSAERATDPQRKETLPASQRPTGSVLRPHGATPAAPPKLPSIWKGGCASIRFG